MFADNIMHLLEDIFTLTKEMHLKYINLIYSLLFPLLVFVFFLLIVTFLLLKLVVSWIPRGDGRKLHVAFFHPYCNAGGGGERVLWRSIQAIQNRYPNIECYVYTGDADVEPDEIMANVLRRFHIRLETQPHFIYLNMRRIIEAKNYPIFTLLLQSLSSLFLGAEALGRFRPDVFIDTMGYAFTYPLFRFVAGCHVVSYTHYPTISSDMLNLVSQRTTAHNNRAFISENIVLSFVKMIYYHMFALLYGCVGSCAHVVMVNSSWTESHISYMWRFGPRPRVVFPPCDTEKFSDLSFISDSEKKTKSIVSIGQFRPEKDFPLQLRSFKRLLNIVDSITAENLRLVLIGGVRNFDDERRVSDLKSLAEQLGISSQVVWKINANFSELVSDIQNGTIGLHTMWNEHFGIGVVESMAGGLIMVAHNSGGPKMDIVIPYEGNITGFLADSEEAYAAQMKSILEMSDVEKMRTRETARRSVCERFSEDIFRNDFLSCVQHIFDPSRSD